MYLHHLMVFSNVILFCTWKHTKLLMIFCRKRLNIFFLHITKEGWLKGGEKGKGVVRKFSFRVVCQNIIPLSLVFSEILRYKQTDRHTDHVVYLCCSKIDIKVISKLIPRIEFITLKSDIQIN